MRSIVAMLMLGVYSLVFVHDLVPHTHVNESKFGLEGYALTQLSHQHSEQYQNKSAAHEWLDLFLSFIISVDHSEAQGHVDHTLTIKLDVQKFQVLLAVLEDYNIFVPRLNYNLDTFLQPDIKEPVLLTSVSRRGPPTFA